MDPAAAVAGIDELMEEILLRYPPDDPARLVRAAIVCKRWRRILADAGFRRRFRELHGTPPMLGLLLRRASSFTEASFTATSSFRLRGGDLSGRCALDARHGRVLLARLPLLPRRLENNLSVWDPITGEHLELPKLPRHREIVSLGWNAAVLCASGACEHLGCHRGPFLVVVVCSDVDGVYVHVYSSEAGAWRDLTFAAHYGGTEQFNLYSFYPSAYAENAIHFMFFSHDTRTGILEYNLGTQEIAQDLLPDDLDDFGRGVLTTTENGGLGFARVDRLTLYLWSREAGRDGYSIWTQSRTIDLAMMFDRLISSHVIGSVHGLHVYFVSTVEGLFSVDLKSGRALKVCNDSDIQNVFPCTNFCTPALGEVPTVEEPSAGASSA
ncbi:unnamed protein product [Urochloa decumbens]|uniref:F-box domain-containing protein n=1 Tax=Urochloa decumbens TaxID=240449 RepID=A0ABC9FNE3_9POAL